MVAFEIQDGLENGSLDEKQLAAFENPPLRDALHWYPDISPEILDLNENLFQGKKCVEWDSYRHLHYLHFGGFRGIYLAHVVSLSVHLVYHNIAIGIEVEYDKEIEGSKTQIIGRRKPSTDKELGDPANPDPTQKVTFKIDGPNAEYITRVEVMDFRETRGLYFKVRSSTRDDISLISTRKGPPHLPCYSCGPSN